MRRLRRPMLHRAVAWQIAALVASAAPDWGVAWAEPLTIEAGTQLDLQWSGQGARATVVVRLTDDAERPIAHAPLSLQLRTATGDVRTRVLLTDRGGRARWSETLTPGAWSVTASYQGQGPVLPAEGSVEVTLGDAPPQIEVPGELLLSPGAEPWTLEPLVQLDGRPLIDAPWLVSGDCITASPVDGRTDAVGLMTTSLTLPESASEPCEVRWRVAAQEWHTAAVTQTRVVPALGLSLAAESAPEGYIPWAPSALRVVVTAQSEGNALSSGTVQVMVGGSLAASGTPVDGRLELTIAPAPPAETPLGILLLDSSGVLVSETQHLPQIADDPFRRLAWVAPVLAGAAAIAWLVWTLAQRQKKPTAIGPRRAPTARGRLSAVSLIDEGGELARIRVVDGDTGAVLSAPRWAGESASQIELLEDADIAAVVPGDGALQLRIDVDGYAPFEGAVERPGPGQTAVIRLRQHRRLVLDELDRVIRFAGLPGDAAAWWGRRSPSEFREPVEEKLRGLRMVDTTPGLPRERLDALTLRLATRGLAPLEALEALFLHVDDACFGRTGGATEADVRVAIQLADAILRDASARSGRTP